MTAFLSILLLAGAGMLFVIAGHLWIAFVDCFLGIFKRMIPFSGRKRRAWHPLEQEPSRKGNQPSASSEADPSPQEHTGLS